MKNIYEETINAVSQGKKFYINLQNKTLKVNGEKIIKDGEYTGELGLEIGENFLEEIEKLYERYKHSVPSETSEFKQRKYFKALKEDELADDDMLFGEGRDTAQVKLELYVLIAILSGSFKWTDSMGKWFWQSEKDKDLVILKSWVETNKIKENA